MKFTSKQKIFTELGWESVDKRIEYLSLCLFHKIHIHETRALIRQCLPPVLQHLNFTRSNKHYNTYPENNTDFCNSFFPKISTIWNNLPFHIRNLDIIDFKIELGKLLKPYKKTTSEMWVAPLIWSWSYWYIWCTGTWYMVLLVHLVHWYLVHLYPLLPDST